METREDFVEQKKCQYYPSSVPAIKSTPLLRESVHELSYGKIEETQVIVAWVRNGHGGLGRCREMTLIGIRCAMKEQGKLRGVVSNHVGASANLRKGDVCVAKRVHDVTNPPIPEYFPDQKIVSLVRGEEEVNATLEVFEFGNRDVRSTSEFDDKESVYFASTIGFFPAIVYTDIQCSHVSVVARIGTNLDNPREFDVVDPNQDPEQAAKRLMDVVMKIIKAI